MRKLSDKKRLVILICIFAAFAMIIASAGVLSKWLIVPTVSAEPTYIVDKDNCDYFTDTAVFNGQDNVPKLKPEWEAVFGGTEFEITWTGGNYYFNSADTSGHYKVGIADGDHDYGAYAGNHFYKIVDKLTGQVLSENHELIVEQADVSIGTLDVQVGFASNTVSWTEVPLIGVGGESVYTLTINKTKTLTATDYGTDGAYAASTATGTTGVLGGNYVAANQHLGGDYARCNYKVPATFDADNDGDYDGLEYSLPFVVLPMCYSTKNTRTYYADLETALDDSESGETVYAMQSFTCTDYPNPNNSTGVYESMVDYNHVISANSSVPTGVILNVPFAADTDTSVTYSVGFDDGLSLTYETSVLKHTSALGVASYQKNTVTISDGVVLENKGKIVISGVVSAGCGGAPNNSLTSGKHGRIVLGNNASITCNTSASTIVCYGFIEESSTNNGSTVSMSSGALTVVYSVSEHRGGSIFLGMANPSYFDLAGGVVSTYKPDLVCAPFNRFYIKSITSKVIVNNGAQVDGYANLYGGGQYNPTTINLIGNSSSDLLQVGTGTQVHIKFDRDLEQHDLDIFGSLTINTLSLLLKQGINLELSTDGVHFPISHYWNIELKKYPVAYDPEGDDAVNVTSTNQDLKILPGASLTIDAGVILNAKSIAVYEGTTTILTPSGAVGASAYPTKASGTLVVNGTLNVASIGGYVQTNNSGAVLNVTDAVAVISKELAYTVEKEHTVLSYTYDGCYYTDNATSTFRLAGPVYHYSGATDASFAIGSYVSAGNAWYTNDSRYEVKYIFCYDDGTPASELSVTSTSYTRGGNLTLSIPQTFPDGYTFDSWYWDADMTELISGATGEDAYARGAADHSITVYGKLKPIVAGEITVNFQNYNLNDNLPKLPDSITVTLQDSVGIVNLTEQLSAYESNAISNYNNKLEQMYYFIGWCDASGEAIDISSIDLTTAVNSQINIYVHWEEKYSITVTTSNATVKVNGTEVENNGAVWIQSGTQVTVDVNYSGNDGQTTIKDTNGTTYSSPFDMPAQKVTINATSNESSSGGSCVTPDTLITLADGTQVRVDSLRGDELLLVWNLETGKLDVAPIMFVDSEAEAEFEIIKLIFSDGTVVNVIYEHGFWDYDLNRYVYLDRDAARYIGHSFAKQNGDKLERVELIDVQIETLVTTAWSPVTVGHLCYFVNGMLSMPGGVGGLFNIFEVDEETMTYDYEAMLRDIETYGLYTYEELNAIAPLSRDMFEAAGGAYLKISIGKGNLTMEELIYMIERYSIYFE